MVPHSVRCRSDSHRAWAAVRVIHPAPALAVTALSAALAMILAREGPDRSNIAAVALITAARGRVAGLHRRDQRPGRPGAGRLAPPEKPLPAGDLSASAALWIAAAGLAVQLVASSRLGTALAGPGRWWPAPRRSGTTCGCPGRRCRWSRTWSASGSCRVWIGVSVGAPIERVAPAVPAGGAVRGGGPPRQHAARLRLGCRAGLAVPRPGPGPDHRSAAGGGPGAGGRHRRRHSASRSAGSSRRPASCSACSACSPSSAARPMPTRLWQGILVARCCGRSPGPWPGRPVSGERNPRSRRRSPRARRRPPRSA